jgi:hypothetical protein
LQYKIFVLGALAFRGVEIDLDGGVSTGVENLVRGVNDTYDAEGIKSNIPGERGSL